MEKETGTWAEGEKGEEGRAHGAKAGSEGWGNWIGDLLPPPAMLACQQPYYPLSWSGTAL